MPPVIRPMSTRVRWFVVGVVLLVLGLAALYYFNSNLTQSTVEEGGFDGRTWVVKPGDTLTLTAEEVGPADRYRCEGKGGVNGTPDPGHGVISGGDFQVTTDLDGTVKLACEPGPPGNV
jgi:hypothetical protein